MSNAELRDAARKLRPVEVNGIHPHARSLFALYRVTFADGLVLAAELVDSEDMAACEASAALWMEFLRPTDAEDKYRWRRSVGCGPGFRERVAYWQIYPLLVHINLFGRSYVARFQRAVSQHL